MTVRTSNWLAGAAALVAAAGIPAPARPQTASGPAIGTAPAKPILTPDATAIWTLQDENATITSAKLSDRYYTNGLRLGFTSGTESVPRALQGLGDLVFGQTGQYRYSIDITQQIYTPQDTNSGNPPLSDRPFAGLLLANLGLLHDTASSRSTLGLSIGVLGPSALGRQIQNGFHDVISQNEVHGWGTQLHDEPVFELLSARTWRQPLGTVFGLETDGLADVSAGLGTVRIYAEGGGQLRLGQGLASDFGTARLRPGISGGDVFRPVRPFAW